MAKDFWNRRSQVTPPVCMVKYEFSKTNRAVFQNTTKTLIHCCEILSNNQAWSMEQHILSRMIYKIYCQLGKEKSVKGLKRIEACIKRVCSLDFVTYIETTKQCMEECDLSCDTGFLPSRQMLEYILVRMMGMAALLTRTACYCVYSYIQVQQHLQKGMFIPQNLIFLSIISRIWALSKAGCQDFVTWYNNLHQSLKHFHSTEAMFLSSDEHLPSTLENWLKQFDRDSENMQSQEEKMLKHLDKSGEGTEASCLYGDEEDNGIAVDIETQDTSLSFAEKTQDLDLGSAVPRSLFETTKDKSNTRKKFNLKDAKLKVSNSSSLEEVKDVVNSIRNKNIDKSSKRKCLQNLESLITKATNSKADKNKKKVKSFLQKGKVLATEFLESVKIMRKEKIEKTNTEHAQAVVLCKPSSSFSEIRQMKKRLKLHGTLTIDGSTVSVTNMKIKTKVVMKLNKCIKAVKSDPQNSTEVIDQTMEIVRKSFRKLLSTPPLQTDVSSKQKEVKHKGEKCVFTNKKVILTSLEAQKNKKKGGDMGQPVAAYKLPQSKKTKKRKWGGKNSKKQQKKTRTK